MYNFKSKYRCNKTKRKKKNTKRKGSRGNDARQEGLEMRTVMSYTQVIDKASGFGMAAGLEGTYHIAQNNSGNK